VNIRDLIKKHEGYSSTVYRCPGGKRTIGWGHNIDANPLPKDIEGYLFAYGLILPEHAERLLDNDICTATQDCQRVYFGFDEFSEARRMALTDFLFNVGMSTAMKFKNMRKAVIDGDWTTAADEMFFSRWKDQVGDRAEEIIGMVRAG
jgi:lysozyme